MLSVLSPKYVQSEWCLRELEHFHRAASQNAGVRIGEYKSRIFKVIKTDLPRDQHPPQLEPMLGYEFFEPDLVSQRPREFNKIYGEEANRKFRNRLNDLA